MTILRIDNHRRQQPTKPVRKGRLYLYLFDGGVLSRRLKQFFFFVPMCVALALTGCAADQSVTGAWPEPVVASVPAATVETPVAEVVSAAKPEPVPAPELPISASPAEPEPTPAPVPATLDELIEASIFPNESGQIMIIMYHGITESEPASSYQRSAEGFRKDLQALYDRGYRLISIADLIDNNIKTSAGYTPVVLSFDDGLPTAFSLRDEGGELVLETGCAVDILTRFAEEHPDFGNTAVFYINGNNDNFQGAGTLQERLRWLVDHGYDLGNHTYSHAKLDRLNAEEMQAEIGKVEELVREAVPGYAMRSLSYPHGIRPAEELRSYVLSGRFQESAYDYAFALREGQSGAAALPGHIRYDPLNMPRVRGSEGAETDLWWTLELYDRFPERRYISDGDPERVTVPEALADQIDTSLSDYRELIFYSKEK